MAARDAYLVKVFVDEMSKVYVLPCLAILAVASKSRFRFKLPVLPSAATEYLFSSVIAMLPSTTLASYFVALKRTVSEVRSA